MRERNSVLAAFACFALSYASRSALFACRSFSVYSSSLSRAISAFSATVTDISCTTPIVPPLIPDAMTLNQRASPFTLQRNSLIRFSMSSPIKTSISGSPASVSTLSSAAMNSSTGTVISLCGSSSPVILIRLSPANTVFFRLSIIKIPIPLLVRLIISETRKAYSYVFSCSVVTDDASSSISATPLESNLTDLSPGSISRSVFIIRVTGTLSTRLVTNAKTTLITSVTANIITASLNMK